MPAGRISGQTTSKILSTTALSLAAIMEISERLNSLPHHKNPQRAPKPRMGRQMLPTEMAWVQKVHEILHLNKMEKPA